MGSIMGASISLPRTRMIDICREADAGSDWATSRSILAYGVRIGIRTNKPELLDRILDYAPPLWKSTSGLRVDRLYSFQFEGGGLRRNGRIAHFMLDDQVSAVRSNSLKTILEAFQMSLRVYVAEMARRRVFVHAGVVGWKGKAIVIPGRSMSGKTSLVAAFLRAGAIYYSDEYAVLDHNGRVHPYPQPLEIRKAGSVKAQKCRAEEIGGVTGTKPVPVGLVVVSRYEVGACWRPRPCSPGQAIMELLANTAPARRKPEVVIPTLHRAASGATVLKSVRGEAERTARLILGRLSRE